MKKEQQFYYKLTNEKDAENFEAFAEEENIDYVKSYDPLDYVVDDIIEETIQNQENLLPLFREISDEGRYELACETKKEIDFLIDREYLSNFIGDNLFEIGVEERERDMNNE